MVINGVFLFKAESKTNKGGKIETDVMDYDGIGIYRRIPDKDLK